VWGSFHDFEGTTVLTYALGLGQATNNQGKAYALLHGLILVKEANIRTLIVFGDSMMVVKAMLDKSFTLGNKLVHIVARLQKEVKSSKIPFYHIK